MASTNPFPQKQTEEEEEEGEVEEGEAEEAEEKKREAVGSFAVAYLGVSFAVFLSLFPSLHSRNRHLLLRLRKAEDELSDLRSRRQEDSKANARVVEIFATHRNSWQQEERRLLRRLDDSSDEISRLRSRLSDADARESHLLSDLDDLRRDLQDRDHLLDFMSRHQADAAAAADHTHFTNLPAPFDTDFISSASKFWPDTPNLWQDVQYDTVDTLQHAKDYVVRRESPWKVDGESTGVLSKLKLLEEELLNLEKVGKNNLVKVASLMRKQAKRYQDLAGKIDDLCKRMQASDPSEPALSSEFRSQRQTEFLLEAFQLQQRATETGKKLQALQTEIHSHSLGDDIDVKLAARHSLDSIRANFKEVQRNLEVWLARIMGDLEGILARDSASRGRDYYFPRYPCVNGFN